MGNLPLHRVLLVLVVGFVYPEEVRALTYDFRIAVVLDSTKMTSHQEFKDQKTLVTMVLEKVYEKKDIEYAVAAYSADESKIFKDFDRLKTVKLSNVHYLEPRSYGFDPKLLFGLKFNKRPDCVWFMRNNDKYTHPECSSTYAPMGYEELVTKIALRFGDGSSDGYLDKITKLADLIANGIEVNKSIHIESNLNIIVQSILDNCKIYQPPPILSTPSAVLTSWSKSTYQTPRILMTSSLTLSSQMPKMSTTETGVRHSNTEYLVKTSSSVQSEVIHTSSFEPRVLYNSTEYMVTTSSSTVQPEDIRTILPVTTATNPVTSVPTHTDPYLSDKIREEYEKLLNYNTNQVNLSNDSPFLNFVYLSSRLLKNIPVLETTINSTNGSIGFHIIEKLEIFSIAVAEKLINNSIVDEKEAKTDNLIVRISSLDTSNNFSGYTFGSLDLHEGHINLPSEIFNKENIYGLSAIVVMIFDPFKPFTDGKLLDGKFNTTLTGKVICVEVLPRPSRPLDKPVTIHVKHAKDERNSTCVFWKPASGGWSTEGCSVTGTNQSITECQCNHMTHYAVLMSLDDQVTPKKHRQAMTIITYIGCSLSIMGVFLTLITFLCLPVLKSERTRIHCNLCVAIGFSQVLFLGAGSKELTDNTIACKLYAAVMLYSFMSVFTWMLVEGIHLYQMVIIAFISRPMMKFYYSMGWGLPATIVIIASAIAYNGYGTSDFCWVSLRDGTIWAFTGPAACIVLVNMFILISVLRLRVKLDISNEARQVAKTGARVSVVLLPLLGMTWIFGFFSSIPTGFGLVFQYLFGIINSLQGLMVFMFHCIGNSEVRKEFFRKAAQWNLRKSLSITNNTMATNKVEPISVDSYDANHDHKND